MNIVYLLTNLERRDGRRFYVGSKTECFIENIGEVDRIVSTKTGLPYYGSSSCPLMKNDMAKGCRFEAKILEEVKNKKDLLDVENSWIIKLNAVESPEFYNMSYARVGGHMVDQTAAYNMHGESVGEYGKRMSSMNKRNNNAKKYGFSNLGEFCVWIYLQFQLGYTSADIAEKIGWERHQPSRYIKPYNMVKCITEYNPKDESTTKKVRLLFAEGCSFVKIAEMLSLEIPTVLLYFGEYGEVHKKSFLVAQRRGLTKEELEVQVTKMVLDGAGFNEVSRELKINETSVKRYFLRCVRRKLKSSDL